MPTKAETKQGWQKLKLNEFVQIDPREVLKKGIVVKHLPMDGISTYTRQIQYIEPKPFSGGSKFRNGDTLFARITPCLENGKTAFVDVLKSDEIASGSTEFIVFRSIKDISDPKYIYYLAVSEDFRKIAIKSMSGTSGRQRVSMGIFNDINFLIPQYKEQKKIAEVLGAYDDLIEVNQKKIKILEELAQSIYKEWFVKPTKDGIPEGWVEKVVGDKIIIKKGKNITKNTITAGDIPVVAGGLSPAYYHNQHTQTEKLKQSLADKLNELVKLNPTRDRLIEAFEKILSEYNSGSKNIEEFFEALMKFAKSLGEEEQRGTREELNEEELAIFDLLYKPELKEPEIKEIKKVAKDLLAKLKEVALTLDWRRTQQGRAGVLVAIKDVLYEELPSPYDEGLIESKTAKIFSHVYESYIGNGVSVYAQ